jgi:hypothetical protein
VTEKEENLFIEIGQKAVSAAEGIDCAFEVFVEGLKSIEEEVRERRRMAEDELRARNGE